MKIQLTIVLVLILSVCSMKDPLSEYFVNPPQNARPQVWWHWIYGNIITDGITKNLEQMKKLGISGVS